MPATLHALLFAPRLRALRIAVFAALLLAVGWLALTPQPPRALSTGWDKSNHLIAFAVLMLVGRLSWPRRPWALGLALLAYGGLIELAQTQVPGRDGEWPDLLADAFGLALGLLADRLLRRARLLTES
jgi:VanZ family protein